MTILIVIMKAYNLLNPSVYLFYFKGIQTLMYLTTKNEMFKNYKQGNI